MSAWKLFYPNAKFKSIYQRLEAAGKTAKIYYFDTKSSSLEVSTCCSTSRSSSGRSSSSSTTAAKATLPDYSFIEPNYSDHDGDSGAILASDQHPDHHVQEGERFIAAVYNAIRQNAALWESTALLIVYDEHGGIYDHVPPPACLPDGFVAQPEATGTGKAVPVRSPRRPGAGDSGLAVGGKRHRGRHDRDLRARLHSGDGDVVLPRAATTTGRRERRRLQRFSIS